MPIYLDNAATSFPKPEPVYAAIDRANREYAVSAGRGRYQRANDLQRLLAQTRTAIADRINAESANEVAFAFSGTDALSTAILGYLKPGDHAIASSADHTSVLRPLWNLQHHHGVELTVVGCDEHGVVDARDIEVACQPNTKMVCLTHASNVTGVLQPVKEAGHICRSKEVAFLVDAAQTIGHHPIDVQQIQCQFLAAPGHKALLGPLGTGFLYVDGTVADDCSPLRFGGTGSTGNEIEQPQAMPQKFESGNLNVPGIAGLKAALNWQPPTGNSAADSEQGSSLSVLSQQLADRLRQIAGVITYGPAEVQTPTISFNIEGLDCQTAGMLLDSQFEIECRTGLHCAPLIHEKIGSTPFGGTVRFSPGIFTTQVEIDQAVVAVESIVRELGVS
ncbi:aminotransferase class V-fold PLP-dependent enzyme [Mariniblastus fucicola]|uniref:cysteine desulfurase n=1 Tax=Mariniblastus fucicola TaxID=980251 RepID=A0A5B9PAA3_9BACT|nr:aminotransferase class V-fold PLP-dependent enzyme [Mariniblastus fucicola]QEG23707.1 putative cysteine desulfurase [Mariniblastus fucicola]